MKHFVVFIILVFAGLFTALFWKNNQDPNKDFRPTLRVYANTSFIKQWGPGPWLKEKFEATCGCRVEFLDASDSQTLIQRLKTESRTNNADVVLGFDQYDLEQAQKHLEWKEIKIDKYDFQDQVKSTLNKSNLVPYDWGVIAFMARPSELKQLPHSLDDLLLPTFKDQISLQDPRTSSAGLQFLLWLIQVKGEEQALQYLQKFNPQVRAYGSSWSMSYGLFQKGQVKLTLSYATSPVYHIVEEKNKDIVALEFNEGHPIQYEYIGIPATCKNCDLAEKFVEVILSPEGQKVIMEKNYMFPVIKGVKDDTVFAQVPNYKILDMNVIPTAAERERILKRWSLIRRAE